MSLHLTVEVSGGTSIENASMDAQRVATQLGVNVEFKFNDVTCWASPDGDYMLLAKRQQFEQSRKLERPMDWRFASSSPRIRHASDTEASSL